VTVNTVFEEREADRMYQLLKYLAALGPDALIVQDFGVLKMARDNFPGLKLHASTQMNIASASGVNALSRQGVSRVVLARELSLNEIRDIRSQTSAELEVFVHGALCMSASGICLFSSFLGGKSANRGLCTQACRRFYRQGDAQGYYFSPADLELVAGIPDLADAGVHSFKIEGRMKSADYVGAVVSAYRRVLDSLEGDREAGIADAREILRNDYARTKTRFYFDADFGDSEADFEKWEDEEEGGASPLRAGQAPLRGASPALPPERGLTAPVTPPDSPPFKSAARKTKPPLPSWLNPAQDGGVGIALGTVLRVRGAGAERRGFIPFGVALSTGDSVRLHRADDSERKAHKITAIEEIDGGRWISIPEGFEPGDSVYLIQQRGMSRRYPPVIREDLGKFKRSPGRDRAPEPLGGENPPASGKTSQRATKQELARALPPGIYAAVSSTGDLFVLQAERPARAILSLNKETGDRLLDSGTPLPFNKEELILSLDPWLPQAEVPALKALITALLELGYRTFILNNPGHFPLFRDFNWEEAPDRRTRDFGPSSIGDPAFADDEDGGRFSAPLNPYFSSPAYKAESNALSAESASGGTDRAPASRRRSPRSRARPLILIAGPWLYTFNRWSAAFVSSLGAASSALEGSLVTPLENNRQNLERTLHPAQRAFSFITLYARPALFRIRADLSAYGFGEFSDGRGEDFRLLTGAEGSRVVPERPFSIIDKRPFLEQSGFRRFIIDLSGHRGIKKKDYKNLMEAVRAAAPLPGISRFNWKDGFFQTEPGAAAAAGSGASEKEGLPPEQWKTETRDPGTGGYRGGKYKLSRQPRK
jgi:collagenase-like PrtC family protease